MCFSQYGVTLHRRPSCTLLCRVPSLDCVDVRDNVLMRRLSHAVRGTILAKRLMRAWFLWPQLRLERLRDKNIGRKGVKENKISAMIWPGNTLSILCIGRSAFDNVRRTCVMTAAVIGFWQCVVPQCSGDRSRHDSYGDVFCTPGA